MPTQQVSDAKVVDTFAWKATLSFKVPTTSDSALLIVSNSPLTSLTLTNKFYGVGSYVAPGVKVLKKFYKGNNTISYSVLGLIANTQYYLAFYTFNNNTNGIFYNQTNPPRIQFKTKGKSIGNYYASLDTNTATFLTKLSQLLRIRNHNLDWYSDFRNVVQEVYERDTFVNDSSKRYVECAYSGIKTLYNPPFSFATTNFNREHTLPKNWMNFRNINNNDLVDYEEGSDWHNLTLTDATVNSQRSDFVFKVPKTPTSIGQARYYENKSKYSDTNNCFEPRNAYKGDAARCIFYMQVCYHRLLDSNWGLRNGLRSFAKYQNVDLLHQWAKNDTPDNQEIARHEYIASVQGSRNPFIDFPDWIDCISFKDISLLKACEGLTLKSSIPTSLKTEWDVWYYKFSDKKYVLKLYHNKVSDLSIQIYDANGRLSWTQLNRINEGENALELDVSGLPSGTYVLLLNSSERIKSVKLLVD